MECTFESELEQKRRGGVSHAPWADKYIMLKGVKRGHEPFVALNNDDDGYYTQYFKSRQEVEAFIKEMQDAADEAWPKEVAE